jgi:hypothetical protein
MSATNPVAALQQEVAARRGEVAACATSGGRLSPFEVQMLDTRRGDYLAEQKGLLERTRA